MRAYYNEIDPYAAEWLRNLIAAGHIAHGDVDERSVEDVTPNDVRGYTQCHFFAGIGMWSYALRLAGWDDSRPAWTGSCPCQGFSAAGKGQGFADERHLWPAWFHLIRECRPRVVFGEQVASAIRHGWLDLVQADMEGEGYACGHAVFGAHSVGAPHIRQRLWFVADAVHAGRPEGRTIAGGRSPAGSGGAARDPRRCNGCDGLCETFCGDEFDTGIMGDAERARLEGHAGHVDDGHEPGWLDAHTPRSAPATGRAGVAGATAGFWRDAEWIACRDGKLRPAKPGIFPLVDGYPGRRVGILRAAGNAIVPQAAEAFIRAYDEGSRMTLSNHDSHRAAEATERDLFGVVG